MTPQQLKAMKLALEALELLTDTEQTFGALDYGDNAITAIKEVLAEHAMQEVQRLGQEIEQKIGCVNHDCDQCKAQPEQEPVAWMWNNHGSIDLSRFEKVGYQPLYTAPPQRKPLTDKAITQVIDSMPKKMKGFMVDWDLYEFARAIEAAHDIKENKHDATTE